MNGRSYAEHFERAKALLRGESYDTSDLGVRKLLGFVYSGEGTNSWIHRELFELHWVDERRRDRHGYYVDVAPGVVWDVMSRMGVTEIRQPTVGHLAPARARMHPLVGDGGDNVAWVVPGANEIQIMIRPLAGRTPPRPMPVPASGPWKLPDALPPWAPTEPVFVEFTDGLNCPRCGHSNSAYRELRDGSLVCQACGRSFER